MIRASDRKGGNALGLEQANDPLIVVNYQFTWALSGDDTKVYATIDHLIAASMDIAKSCNRLERYINQKPIGAYGPAQVDFLRLVKAKYDPNGVFDKLSRGGFKISI
ncbi:hypothetical protein BN14_05856 [Rhizoctonia solani AG-1 IB]|uniref:Berberine/berberine-like domain-containing protein n=1 Tax=Thanatephorus cucumeris (strain AG1-IB / isolate 7/3/14) TaxID=1108050 RepID=M5BXA9_THACB|nr:hypothetical protein BN14_05856 [Rhizoctonia solani AG-1 IB]